MSVECGVIRAPRSGWWECKLAQQLWKLCLGIQSDYRWTHNPARALLVGGWGRWASLLTDRHERESSHHCLRCTKPEDNRLQEEAGHAHSEGLLHCDRHTMANLGNKKESFSRRQQPGWISQTLHWKKKSSQTHSNILYNTIFMMFRNRQSFRSLALSIKASWASKNWCFWTVVLEKTLRLDCKEIQPVLPKGDQSWVFIARTNAEAETSILWPPDAKNRLTDKDPDAGKDGGQGEKEAGQDEMVGWHHWLSGHEFEQGQESLACCSP